METSEAPKGSMKHADGVMDVAREILSELPEKNIFMPQVLVTVSCNSRCLNGFISTNDDSVQERSSLAACTEYGPVNSLLTDSGEVLSESEQTTLELKWK
ncbi:uncharacterized protein LOC111335930 [Stylophora pistillata]|uniref:uncharacterized protein LOC111335930 n=1 Tax=Stylophora pistillata TaxID=50429 RepID=UPI000C03BEF7|nr:uncharacterized protein LOC111335930 [Stylophora pistillata]